MPSSRSSKQSGSAGAGKVAAPKAAGKRTARRKVPRGGPTKAELRKYRAALMALRGEILRSNRNLAEEALKGSGQDVSVDHMADHGTDNFEQDFSLSLLEGESEIFQEIQDALAKIDGTSDAEEGYPYGLCETCADEHRDAEQLDRESEGSEKEDGPAGGQPISESPWIPKGRLEAVPYARLCVAHQEREEQARG